MTRRLLVLCHQLAMVATIGPPGLAAQIASTGSPHGTLPAGLECTTCHTTPEGHKVTPHSVLPTKPVTRDFCGTCHSTESGAAGVPHVDIRTHWETYLCWQCHYPHLPEVE